MTSEGLGLAVHGDLVIGFYIGYRMVVKYTVCICFGWKVGVCKKVRCQVVVERLFFVSPVGFTEGRSHFRSDNGQGLLRWRIYKEVWEERNVRVTVTVSSLRGIRNIPVSL